MENDAIFQSRADEFISLYCEHIKREGADKLLNYLRSGASDFFTAPCSTQFHGNYEGGLVEHSVNVYHCLKDYLARERVREEYGLSYDDETIAIVSLLHDLCKVNVYRRDTRNVKENGEWVTKPYFRFDDPLPYGHGEKSVYIISGFMRLSREEAFAIRYHMGFSSDTEDKRNVGKAFELFPLAFALSTADMEATYFLEHKR